MKIKELFNLETRRLNESKIEDANIIAKSLIKYVLKLTDNDLIVKQNNEVESNNQKEYEEYINQIIEGTPLQYITNKQEFYKQEFYVDEDVLIPQPDTEILVEEVINIAKKDQKLNILDICTGSGAIGISLANNIKNADVTLVDVSSDALEVAEINCDSIFENKITEKAYENEAEVYLIEENGIKQNIKLHQSDMFDELEEEFDIIVSNPPYIKTKEIKQLSKQVKNEPRIALDGGEDGLYYYRVLIDESHKFLSDDGYLCMEIGYDQKTEVIKLLEESGMYKNIYSKKDLAGNDRIVIAQRIEG